MSSYLYGKNVTWLDPKDGSVWDRSQHLTKEHKFPMKILEVSVKKNKLRQSDQWISDFQKDISLINFFDQSSLDLENIKKDIKSLDKEDGIIIRMPMKYDTHKMGWECIRRSFCVPRGYYLKDNELYVQTRFLDQTDGDGSQVCSLILKEQYMGLLSNFFLSIPLVGPYYERFKDITLPYIDDQKRVIDLEKENQLALDFPSYINRHLSYQGFLFIHERIKEIADEYFHMECIGTMRPEE